MHARIRMLIGILLLSYASCEKRPESQIADARSEWPSLTKEHWRELILMFVGYGGSFDPDKVVLGDPVPRTEIDSLEAKIGLPLSEEFRQFYQSQNGFGLIQPDGKIDWVFVPLKDIPKLTAKTEKWIGEFDPELQGRILAFVDWDEFESAGILYSSEGKPSTMIYGFLRGTVNHGTINGGEKAYYPLEVTIANVLTEPMVPPRLIRQKSNGEQVEALKP